ncbi:MAG: T9SS C-terminal target domain-containing protein [Calditrichaeota bacterium]|nr:MAG: T9SS C-terminal target domain-containing protein [Calditrichota bacterium]
MKYWLPLLSFFLFNSVFAQNSVVVNEIMYNSGNLEIEDWVEIFNNSPNSIQLKDWTLKDSNDENIFVFPSYILTPNSFVVLCRDSLNFIENYPTLNQFVGNFDFGLGNSGDQVHIFDSNGVLVDSLFYSDKLPWTPESDGTGLTLELFSPELDNTLVGNWTASSILKGTPNAQNSITQIGNIPPQILSVNHLPLCPTIENLISVSAKVIDSQSEVVVKLHLKDKENFNKVEMFDNGLNGDLFANDLLYTAQVQLNENQIEFYVSATDDSDSTNFFPHNFSEELIQISLIKSRKENFNVLINELMYNSSDEFPVGDWVEIFNNSDSEIDLTNWVLRDSDFLNSFTFPSKEIKPNEFLVICSDTVSFQNYYPLVQNVIGDLDFGFSGNSDQVRLFDNFGVLVDSFEYLDSSPWASNADGNGSSLEKDNPILVSTFPQSWSSSDFLNGTPGEMNSVFDEKCNHSPIFISTPKDTILRENQLLEFELFPIDLNGDSIFVFAENLPKNSVFNPPNFSWIPDFTQSGNYKIKFFVSDSADTTDFELEIEVLDAIIPTQNFAFFYGDSCFQNGSKIQVGDSVFAFDPQGVKCGEFVVTTEGEFGLMAVYGDDLTTESVDEGAEFGDKISFKINGESSLTTNENSDLWFGENSISKINLYSYKINIFPNCADKNDSLIFITKVNNPTLIQSIKLNFDFGNGIQSVNFRNDGNGNDALANDNFFTVTLPPSEVGAELNFGFEFLDLENDSQFFPPQNEPKLKFTIQEDFPKREFTVLVNEIMFNGDKIDDWVEITNASNKKINIGNWILRDNNFANSFQFPQGTILKPNEFLVICKNTSNFSQNYPSSTNFIGELSFNLSNSADTLFLFNEIGEGIDSLFYADSLFQNADGKGFSVARKNTNLIGFSENNWIVSQKLFGTPCEKNRVFDGLCNHTPELLSPKTTFEVSPNDTLKIDFPIFEPNGDSLIYSLESDFTETFLANENSEIFVIPSFFDIGAKTVIAKVSDGFEEVEFHFQVKILGDSTNFNPEKINLAQNFPNPFNPRTEINFYLPERAKVTLNIFNVKGQEVVKLTSNTFEKGSHRIFWDGTNKLGKQVSSGIYFYRLKTDGFEQTKKMLLLR